MKLHQVVALEAGLRIRTEKTFALIKTKVTAVGLFAGQSRTYTPRAEDGWQYPDEYQSVQLTADAILGELAGAWSPLVDFAATRDIANTHATAGITVDDVVLVADVPVPFLLFLEKQLDELAKIFSVLPTHDPARSWRRDGSRGVWAAASEQTTKLKKTLEPIVLYPSTDHHPAQVEKLSRDVPEGTWTTTALSGAIPADRKRELLARVAALSDAVKDARARANDTEVTGVSVASTLVDYLFG